MTMYYYVGGNKEGATFKGEIDAEDSKQAVDKVRRQGLFVLDIRKSTQIGPFDIEALKDNLFGCFSAELSPIERILFTSHLSSMLKTGVPMIEAIAAFEDKDTGRSKKMFEKVVSDLESGKPLSVALGRFPRTFSPIYSHIISSGESMGTLGETLEYLAHQLRRDYELISRVRGAMMYPIVVITIMLSVLIFITVSVVPKLLTFSQNVGRELPLSTKILIFITNFIINYGILVLFGIILLAVALVRFSHTERGKAWIDLVLLRFPMLGVLIREYNVARFCRLLGSFYHYGIPLPTAFSILGTSLSNVYYQKAVLRIKERMGHGMSLSAGLDLEDKKLFPKLLVRVLRTAEKSADVDQSLTRIAEYYESEMENTLKNVTTLIEPILILVLGVAVMGIALAVVVPIYQITTSFK